MPEKTWLIFMLATAFNAVPGFLLVVFHRPIGRCFEVVNSIAKPILPPHFFPRKYSGTDPRKVVLGLGILGLLWSLPIGAAMTYVFVTHRTPSPQAPAAKAPESP